MTDAREKPTMDQRLRAYVGGDPTALRSIEVASMSVGDHDSVAVLMDKLATFRKAAEGADIHVLSREVDCDSYLTGYSATRMETPDEAMTRVQASLDRMLADEAAAERTRRRTFEELKKVYEPG